MPLISSQANREMLHGFSNEDRLDPPMGSQIQHQSKPSSPAVVDYEAQQFDRMEFRSRHNYQLSHPSRKPRLLLGRLLARGKFARPVTIMYFELFAPEPSVSATLVVNLARTVRSEDK